MSDIKSNYYWGIDLPGLTETQATSLLAAARQETWGGLGYLVDPSTSLTLHLDRGSVEILLSALRSATGGGFPGVDKDLDAGVRSLIEIFEDWTEFTTADVTDGLG